MAKRSPNRVTETEVAEATLQVLAKEPNGEAAIGKIVAEVPNYLKLSDEDRTPSTTRVNEQIWE
jgi:hydrogenase maturation factor